jgi:hypothetical protein
MKVFDAAPKASGTAWTAYTPTWVAASGTPLIGNGTLAGRYKIEGKTCHFTIDGSFGSTSSYNGATGAMGFSLPPGVTAKTGGLQQIVPGYYLNTGSNHLRSIGKVAAGTTKIGFIIVSDSTTTEWTVATGIVSNGDLFTFSGAIEID